MIIEGSNYIFIEILSYKYRPTVWQVFNIKIIISHVVEMSDAKLSAAKPADRRLIIITYWMFYQTKWSLYWKLVIQLVYIYMMVFQ